MQRPEHPLTFEKTLDLPVSAEDAFAWHARPGAFDRLKPPWLKTEILQDSNGIEPGSRLVFRVKQGPFWIRWVAEHRNTIPGREFTDVQIEGPFAFWEHVHRFEPTPAGCRLRDSIEYALPLSWLSHPLAGWFVRRDLERMFDFRHRKTLEALPAQDGNSTPAGSVGGSGRQIKT